jgi:glycosyltransferase involved in cell wall biosynthesis
MQRCHNVEFIDQVSAVEAATLINAADVLIIHMPTQDGEEFSLPHRLYSYLLCGKPIVAATDGTIADIVQETGCGWVCSPCDERGLASLLATIKANPVECQARGKVGADLACGAGPLSRTRRLEELEVLLCNAAARH